MGQKHTAMKPLLLSLLALLPLAGGRAALLGADVNLTPPPKWKSVEPFSPLLEPSPYATLKFVPADGGHAALIITLLPADVLGFAVHDCSTLAQFTLVAAQPYFPSDAPPPRLIEQGLPSGLAACITVTMPSEPGSATNSADAFRMATTATLLLDSKHLVHFAILHDAEDAPEFRQAVETIRTVRLRDAQTTAMGKREVRDLARAELVVRR